MATEPRGSEVSDNERVTYSRHILLHVREHVRHKFTQYSGKDASVVDMNREEGRIFKSMI